MSTSTITPGTLAGEELIAKNSPLARFISVDHGRLHGEPCFAGTRVPVQTLFDHLRCGDSLQEFLDGFPDVSREQACKRSRHFWSRH